MPKTPRPDIVGIIVPAYAIHRAMEALSLMDGDLHEDALECIKEGNHFHAEVLHMLAHNFREARDQLKASMKFTQKALKEGRNGRQG